MLKKKINDALLGNASKPATHEHDDVEAYLVDLSSQVHDKNRYKFVIPSRETIDAIRNGNPLTLEQIEEVFEYIENNFYVDPGQFKNSYINTALFIDVVVDKEEYSDRIKDAATGIVNALYKGEPINIDDALWCSASAYVDGELPVQEVRYKDENGEIVKRTINQKEDPSLPYKVGALRNLTKEFHCALFNGTLRVDPNVEINY